MKMKTKLKLHREIDVMKAVLSKYKATTMLWDSSHPFYHNKIKRRVAYLPILKIYRRIDPDANVSDIRRKIDNMRTTYRREQSKVIKSQMEGEQIYEPTLWYYNILSFIDDTNTRHVNDTTNEPHVDDEKSEDYIIEKIEENFDENADEAEVGDEALMTAPPAKRIKSELIYLSEPSISDENEENRLEDDPQSVKEAALDAFGKTIGLQLAELEPVQRFLAEKLISEIIFFGRMNELDMDTVILKKK